MTQAQTLAAQRPVQRARSTPKAVEVQEAKRFEKMQAHCSSHHTAGTHETPASTQKAGILGELESEGGQH